MKITSLSLLWSTIFNITAVTVNSWTRTHYRLNMCHSQSVTMLTATGQQEASSDQWLTGNVTHWHGQWWSSERIQVTVFFQQNTATEETRQLDAIYIWHTTSPSVNGLRPSYWSEFLISTDEGREADGLSPGPENCSCSQGTETPISLAQAWCWHTARRGLSAGVETSRFPEGPAPRKRTVSLELLLAIGLLLGV
jgi:hypothetical protein